MSGVVIVRVIIGIVGLSRAFVGESPLPLEERGGRLVSSGRFVIVACQFVLVGSLVEQGVRL